MKPGYIALIVAGALVTVAVPVTLGILFYNASQNVTTVNNEYTFTDVIENVDINLVSSDITFKKAVNNECKIEVIEKNKLHHDVKVTNKTLTIRQVDESLLFEKFFVYQGLSLSITLPEKEYSNLFIGSSTGNVNLDGMYTFNEFNISTSTGDINVSNLTINNSMKVGASTGNINLDNVKADSMNIKASTGDVYLNNSISNSSLNVATSTGSVDLIKSDAGAIDIHTSTGNVKGNLLSPKSFQVKTNTGSIHVPSTTGPVCKIETSTGEINITIVE